jgi:two-component system KDP operon response regulator KdpE
MTGRVLVVEDEVLLRGALRASLRARGFTVEEAADGAAALVSVAAGRAEVVLLDLGLPDRDGAEVLADIRATSSVPVIVLTARDQPSEKVALLEAGADDYVTKPFDTDELAARIRVALRRSTAPPVLPPVVEVGDLRIDLTRRMVTRAGEKVALTRTELGLLEVLVRQPGRLLTHDVLLQAVWGPTYSTESNYLRTYVAQLRKKLGDVAASPRLIATEPGVGYRWVAEPAGASGTVEPVAP